MIRLNDDRRTVIDESKVVAYYGYEDEKVLCVDVGQLDIIYVEYDSKEQKDKDIELLDKLFDTKSIEDYVYGRYPDETQTIENFKNQVDNVDKYITWKDVKRLDCCVKVYLPNGNITVVHYDDDNERIQIESSYGDTYDGCIYDEDLFNALMLKRV